MVRYLLPFVLLLSVGAIISRASASEYLKTYPITGRANVRVHTDDGSVRVITSEANQVEFRVKYDVSPWRLGFGTSPHVDSSENGSTVELNASTGWQVGVGIGGEQMSIEVHMPRDADLQLETVDGRVDISSLNGHIIARSVDGGVQVAQLSGTIDIHTSDGAINANALKGDLKLQSADGAISGSNLDGRCVAHSADGAVRITGRFDSLDVRSEDGMVTAKVEAGSTISAPWQIRSADGSVRLALPGDLKANLDASTGSGHISVHLPVEGGGRVSKSEFHAALNGGGPSVVVRTRDGSIDLDRL